MKPSAEPIPASFSLIRKKKACLWLRDEYRDGLLEAGIEDPEALLRLRRRELSWMAGRKAHPCLPLPDGKKMVIRQYTHGGLLGFAIRDLYFAGSRALDELRLTEAVRAAGIPTVESVGAMQIPTLHFFYRAFFLSVEKPGALDLLDFFRNLPGDPTPEALLLKRNVIHETGRVLRRFHDAGFYHADLQLKNLLTDGHRVLVIDLDRSLHRDPLSAGERMSNLLRLNRSVEKHLRQGLRLTRTDRWRFFTAYADGDSKVRAQLRKALRLYPWRMALHRFSWTIRGLVEKK
jgi:tRNA A-37 threonylcarbamoyl transferase component Bud32